MSNWEEKIEKLARDTSIQRTVTHLAGVPTWTVAAAAHHGDGEKPIQECGLQPGLLSWCRIICTVPQLILRAPSLRGHELLGDPHRQRRFWDTRPIGIGRHAADAGPWIFYEFVPIEDSEEETPPPFHQ